MNGSLIAFLVVAISWRSLEAVPNPKPKPIPVAIPGPVPPNVQALCKKSVHVQSCIATVQADPRQQLKSTPEGVVVILVDAAKMNAKTTTQFLKENIHTIKAADVMEQVRGCIGAYEATAPDLNIDPATLGTPDGKKDAIDAITSVEMDVSYDCAWEELKTHPQLVSDMKDRVNKFSASLIAATAILSPMPYN